MASDPEWQQEQAGGHKEIGHKSLLESDALYQQNTLGKVAAYHILCTYVLVCFSNTMEIGVYIGYSLLSTLGLPQDGKILAMDINRENYELGLPIIQNAGVSHKIDFREGLKIKYHGTFDFIFVDADKDNYLNYHKRIIELEKDGGVIGHDNTLWNASVVAPPDAPLMNYVRFDRDFVLELKHGSYC
ncbi:hypothetical protein PRUPE_7G131200 [Prunus persica]|uniref:caffeoyl-CoA O-methyltransferase n=1 Tax=Prunus persica TaxID=3760 RepID=M5WAK7_PRUPE|nr:hypothetical protein PRUPE_7G131200 [Prunus persica]